MSNYRVPLVRVQLIRDSSYSMPRRAEGPFHIAQLVRDMIGDPDREHLVLLGINPKNQVVAGNVVAIGQQSSLNFCPREVLRAVLLMGVSSFVLAHNHPSDDAKPSMEDEEITFKMNQVSHSIGLQLMDHVVVTHHSYYSFFESGKLHPL